ncbi:hypothetical protein HGG75_10705 [Ochrobactrum pseudogrignonense]|nr:hypothetical protein [Brucella pseudogrignonensis]
MGTAALTYYPVQNTFDKGEISPLLGARSDVDFWRSSLEFCRNFNVLTHGGLRRRSGTVFLTEVADSSQFTRLLSFRFSEDQAYVLALNGNGTMRFLSERQQLISGGVPYSIAQPFSAAALPKVSYDQFNDTAYLAHKNYRPRKLSRLGDVNWTIENAPFEDGPYLDRDLTVSTRFTPSGLGSPPVSSSSKSTSLTSGYVEFILSSPVAVDAYWILSVSDNPGDSPSGWKFSGWDGEYGWFLTVETAKQGGFQVRDISTTLIIRRYIRDTDSIGMVRKVAVLRKSISPTSECIKLLIRRRHQILQHLRSLELTVVVVSIQVM